MTHVQNLKIKTIEIQDRINKLFRLLDTCTSTRQRDLYEGGMLVLEEQLQDYLKEIRFETRNDDTVNMNRHIYFD